MELVSVTQAASLLGVTPTRVRQRIAEGSLPAEKVGRTWVLDRATVVPAVPGRPLEAAMALAVAAAWDGIPPRPAFWQEARVRAKVREIENWSDDDLPRVVSHTFARRARRRVIHLPRARVAALRADSRVLKSGVCDPRLVIVCEPAKLPSHASVLLEAYLPWRYFAAVLRDHGLPSWDQMGKDASPGSSHELTTATATATATATDAGTELPVVLRRSDGWLEQVPRLFSMADLLERQDNICTDAAVRLFRGRRRLP